MLPPLSEVDTFCLALPTFSGLGAVFSNALVVSDWAAVNYRVIFIASGIFLWTYPSVFTWPVWPFKTTFLYILYLLGFEKGGVRKDSYATHWQRESYGGHIPEYSTFSHLQSAAALSGEEDEERVPIYARVLGWIAGFLAVRAMFL